MSERREQAGQARASERLTYHLASSTIFFLKRRQKPVFGRNKTGEFKALLTILRIRRSSCPTLA